MAIEVKDLRYGKAAKSTRDLILIVLAKEFPLTIGGITRRLNEVFHVSITFQAVRKSLNSLSDKGILSLKDGGYRINKEYIMEQKRLTDQLMENYYPGEERKRVPPREGAHADYKFENLIQADQFWAEAVLNWAYNLGEKDDRRFFFHGPHCWYIFGHPGLESEFLMKLKAHGVKSYYLNENDTSVDLWAGKFYRSHGVTYKTKSRGSKEMRSAIGVFGDSIIQYDYPPEIFKKIESFYRSAKNLETMDLSSMAKTLKLKTPLTVTVIRNKALAEKLKKEISSNSS